MSNYVLALFVHVSGAIGICITLGIWLFGLAALRRAQRVEQVRALAWLIVVTTPLMFVSLVLLGVAGLYMALTVWGLQTAWVAVSLASLLIVGPVGAFVLDPRIHTILDGAREAPDGPLSEAMVVRIRDPLLPISALTMATVLLGVVFLMTTKPPLMIAIMVMGAALALGLLVGLPAVWTARRRGGGVDGRVADPFQRATIWTRRW
jgi:hypothetical protein